MKLRIIKDGEYVKYLREGSCNMCGECCCKNFISSRTSACIGPSPDKDDDEDFDLGRWEGFSHFKAQGFHWWMRFFIEDRNREQACSSFIDGKCKAWKSDDWLALCRYFPVHPKDIEKFPECTFSFREIGEEE